MEFDFQAYIRDRKGGGDRRAASGLGYAFARDRRVMRTLDMAKPVKLAIDASTRLGAGRFDAILEASQVASANKPEGLLDAVATVCKKLQATAPDRVHIAADDRLGHSTALAHRGDELLVVTPAMLELTAAQQAFHLGRALGHLQHGHALYLGAAWLLADEPASFLRWIVKPASAALESWSRLGDVTADRAGLLATGDLALSVAEIMRLSGVVGDGAEVLAEGGMADLDEVLAGRIRALQTFSEAEVFRRSVGLDGGDSLTSVDSRVEAVIKLV